MPKVLCTLPNASDEISGVKFVTHAKGMLSEDVADEVAAAFTTIPGYELVGAKGPDDSDDDSAEKDALLARAEAVKLAVKNNWGLPRLKAEVEKAEAEAADATAKAATAAAGATTAAAGEGAK